MASTDSRVDGEVETGGQGRGAEHAHRVLAEAHRGVADGADHALLEVPNAADPVDDGEGRDVVADRVHREIAAEGVLFRRAEGVVAADQRIALLGGGLLAEGRDLDHLAAEPHVAQTEAPTHDEAVAEELLDLLGVGRGADVEVLGPALEQQVAHPAPDQVGHVPVVLQTVENLEGVLVDVLAGDVVLGPGEDAGGDVPGGVLHGRIIPAPPGPRGGARSGPLSGPP